MVDSSRLKSGLFAGSVEPLEECAAWGRSPGLGGGMQMEFGMARPKAQLAQDKGRPPMWRWGKAIRRLGAAALVMGLFAIAAGPAWSQPRQVSSVPEVQAAIAAQVRVIQDAQGRHRNALSAAQGAAASLQEAERRLEQALSAETAREPVLNGLEHHLRAQALSPTLQAEATTMRGNLAMAEVALDRLRTDQEDRRAAGLAFDEGRVRLMQESVGLMRGRLTLLDKLFAARDRVRTQREATFAAVREFREKVNAQKRAEDELRASHQERYRLYYLMGTRFAPRYLHTVSASTVGGAEFYRASVSASPEWSELATTIDQLLAGLEGARNALVDKRRAFLEAEARFVEVARKCEIAHSSYSDSVQHAYYLEIGVNLADSAIGLISGRLDPAGVGFELAWRAGEYFYKEYRIDEPPIGDALALYRSNLAQKLEQAALPPATVDLRSDEQWLEQSRARLLSQSQVFVPDLATVRQHVIKEQTDEFLKGSVETVITEPLKWFANVAVERNLGGDRLSKFLDGLFRNEKMEARFARLERLDTWIGPNVATFMREGDAAGELLAKTEQSWLKGKGKDILLGAVVTAGQAAATAAHRQAMAKLATEVALLDIEWLLRRHEYAMRGAEYRAFGMRLAEVEAAIGGLIEQAASPNRSRILTVAKQASVPTDKAVRLHLAFSSPVESAVVLVGGKQFGQVAQADGTVTLTLPENTFEAGTLTLAVAAVSQDVRFGLDFDADPTTMAVYSPAPSSPLRMTGLEGGSDRKHRLSFTAAPAAEPFARVTVAAGNRLPAGKGRLVLIARDALGQSVRPPVSVFLGESEVEYINPNFNEPMTLDVQPGSYNLTFHYFAAPLEKRGVAVTAGKVTTVEVGGYGRLQMTVLDPQGKSIRPPITISQGEREVEHINPNFNEPMTLDLPAGVYDLLFHIGEGVTRKGVVVVQGKITPVTLQSAPSPHPRPRGARLRRR